MSKLEYCIDEIDIKLADTNDSKDIWHWRNNKVTRKMFNNMEEVSWQDHEEWFKNMLCNQKSFIYIGVMSNKDNFGMVRFDVIKKIAEISINLNPKYRSLNLSYRLLLKAINQFSKNNNSQIIAKVKTLNTASKKCFIKAGFKLKKEEQDYLYYEYEKLPKLSFKFIASACGIFTGKNGTQVLCDPWIVDGVFNGSWCHYPKLKTTNKDIENVDAIYISHLHPDHFDERNFDFRKDIPLIVLDHGPNFLIKKLTFLGYTNLIKIKNNETINYREFKITMFSPFAKHNFHDAKIGNLIDSAMLISCDEITALNANDNTPSIETSRALKANYGPISLAMINYNAAGPYPSCFDNSKESEKLIEHHRILERNFTHLKKITEVMGPKFLLPFAGSYVLGGDLHYKNNYLGTTTWDNCAKWLRKNNIKPTKVVLLRENDLLNIENGISSKRYIPIDEIKMKNYINKKLSKIKYPYQLEPFPDKKEILVDVEQASISMNIRMERMGIKSTFNVILNIFNTKYQIYPTFKQIIASDSFKKKLECSCDERLLRNILDRKSHWNNAEIGAHISFIRIPNNYEPDLHTGLQFFHL